MRKKKKIQLILLSLLLPSALILLLNIVFYPQLSYNDFIKDLHSGSYVFILIAFLSSFWSIKTSRYGSVHMLSPVVWGVLLIYGSPFAVFILCGVLLINTVLRLNVPKRFRIAILKENTILLASMSISIMFYRICVGTYLKISSVSALQSISCFLLSLLLFSLIVHFLITFDRVVSEGLDRRYFVKFNLVSFNVSVFTVFPLAVLISVIASINVWALFFLAPIYIMYSSMKNYIEISNEVRGAIEDLAISYEKRDPYSSKHSLNVARIAELIGRELLLSDEEIEKIVSAAKVHDIGKIGIADDILSKGRYSGLTQEEFEEIRKHPATGRKVTSNLSWYKSESDMVYYHHEWYDGSGYPEGLKGEQIPLGARILAVAEAYDAMASPRAYRDSLSEEFICEELYSKKGTQFDPGVVDAMLIVMQEKKLKKAARHLDNLI